MRRSSSTILSFMPSSLQLCRRSGCFRLRDPFSRLVSLPATALRWSDQIQASGLLYVSELIEEHSRLAKLIGQRGTHVCTLSSLSLSRTLTSVLLDYHYFARIALCQRFSPPAPNDILNRLPYSIFAELLVPLAAHLPVFHFIHCFLCDGYHESLSVVHSLLSPRSRCETNL